MEKIQNLINTCLKRIPEMTTTEQTEYAVWTLKQVQEELNNLKNKKYYVRVCKDEFDELDLYNLQLFSEEDIKDEFVAIDYIDEDEMDNLTIEDLQEIAFKNGEALEEISVIQNL